MKKLSAVMFVAILCIASVFALELNVGSTVIQTEATAWTTPTTYIFASQDIANIEVGAGVLTTAPAAFVKGFITAEVNRFQSAFAAAKAEDELDVFGYVLFNVVKSDAFKLGAGLMGSYGLEGSDTGNNNIKAIAKTSLKLSKNRSIFAFGFAPVADLISPNYTDCASEFMKSFTIGYSFNI